VLAKSKIEWDTPTLKKASPKEAFLIGLQSGLASRFRFGPKTRIKIKDHLNILNFACPICGDSDSDVYKKRGNLYIDNASYYCFNCGQFRTAMDLFLGMGLELDGATQEWCNTRSQTRHETPIERSEASQWLDLDRFPTREGLIMALGWQPIETVAPIRAYLQSRLQRKWDRFLWDPRGERIAILNRIEDRIIGIQFRNQSESAVGKYSTHSWRLCHQKWPHLWKSLSETQTGYVSKTSTVFNIFEADLNQPVPILEGPLDSFLLNNSIATASGSIGLAINLPNRVWIYDWDTPGRVWTRKKLAMGETVFLWKPFLEAHSIPWSPHKKIDLNDLLVYCWKSGIQIKNWTRFYSKNPLDVIYV
jgi:hypothetical protein